MKNHNTTPTEKRPLPRSARAPRSVLLAAGLLVAPLAHAQITTLLSDTFTDGGRGNGVDATDSAWFGSFPTGAVFNVQTTDTEFSGGYAQYILSTGTNGITFTNFTSQTLASVGDKLELSFKFRTNATLGSVGEGIRVGFWNNGGTIQASDATGSLNNDTGYFVTFNAAGSSGAIRKDSSTTSSGYFSTGGMTTLGTGVGFFPNTGTTTLRTFGLVLERTETGVSITASVTGGNTFTAFDNSVTPITSFDSLGMLWNNASGATASIRFDDVTVTYTAVPEPSAFAAFGGLGALGFAALRRGRRSRA